MDLLFLPLSSLLLLSHTVFFFRAIFYYKREFTPQFIDKAAKTLSITLLIPTLIVATTVVDNYIYLLLIWAPVLTILISNFNKRVVYLKPFLFPMINLLLFISIFLLSLKEGL
ncbi:hypothetical protein EW093_12350 [Thiospirochaeta perfilievii]|uniref:Uncharacterized protein n=1 Tax=Thiospirochaeta perfilievii TaxID=252967 RepID=A0A5C1QD35_9SPIO|nr:hypothetical protein [Thiospirochaeta perfilievii]QEN05471.1 hypothetical protein EW093_12350 [Thiospirochaeta perfilievii]